MTTEQQKKDFSGATAFLDSLKMTTADTTQTSARSQSSPLGPGLETGHGARGWALRGVSLVGAYSREESPAMVKSVVIIHKALEVLSSVTLPSQGAWCLAYYHFD